ncbi:MAG: hypothetical protein OXG25_09060 [Gammaproteobacteria bacterium]|nr:hypothetical protein [Gammaproteobacteria bacterium]
MSSGQMSRRKFLAVVGGAGGALGVAGLGSWRLLGGGAGSASAAGGFAVDPGVEVVEVASGFADAAVWKDELLTLRAGPVGSGIVLRSETTGTDHPVDTPVGFTARCVGVIDDTLIIGGHQDVDTGQMTFQADADYEQLLRAAGSQSALLLAQPHRPIARPHVHTDHERRAVGISTADLEEWKSEEVKFSDGTNGSIAAILEHSSLAALDHYSYPGHTDSIYEVALFRISSMLSGTAEFVAPAQEVDHGAVWGAVGTWPHDVVVVSDRYGTRGYRATGELEFSIGDGSRLLGVRSIGTELEAYVSGFDSAKHSRIYASGEEVARRPMNDLALHQVAPDISLALSDRRLAGVFPTA